MRIIKILNTQSEKMLLKKMVLNDGLMHDCQNLKFEKKKKRMCNFVKHKK